MQDDKNSHIYDDIIHLPHPTSSNHPRMPLDDRAAQFAPFAALTGHDAAIKETERLTDARKELDESALRRLDEQLHIICENIDSKPQVTVTYFVPDDRKAGGTYVSCDGIIKKIDVFQRAIIMKDKKVIPFEYISAIEILNK